MGNWGFGGKWEVVTGKSAGSGKWELGIRLDMGIGNWEFEGAWTGKAKSGGGMVIDTGVAPQQELCLEQINYNLTRPVPKFPIPKPQFPIPTSQFPIPWAKQNQGADHTVIDTGLATAKFVS